MAESARFRDDVRVSTLIREARVVDTLTPSPDALAAARPSTGGSVVTALFADPAALESALMAAEEYGALVPSGRAIIEDLHQNPLRELQLPKSVHIFGAYSSMAGLSVVHAEWEVDRAANKVVIGGHLDHLDDFRYPDDGVRLGRVLRDIVLGMERPPRVTDASVRVALLVTSKARNTKPSLATELAAAIAVGNGVVSVDLGAPNPSDDNAMFSLDRSLRANSHATLVAAHDHERWVWRRVDAYRSASPSRAAVAVLPDDSTAVDAVQAAIETRAKGVPVPTLNWGPAAAERVARREGDAFVLTPRAREQLRRNAYPRVDRMLEHVERLADLAQALQSGDLLSRGRLADAAHTQFGIEVALHDASISDAAATIVMDGTTLIARPHVKVDDVKDANDCGRIYFAIDADRRRVVVDHIGLHDRY